VASCLARETLWEACRTRIHGISAPALIRRLQAISAFAGPTEAGRRGSGGFSKRCLLMVCAAATTGCAALPYRQDVTGVMTLDGKPVGALSVRFISELPADTCEHSGVDAVTDSEGRFGINQVYEPSIIESAIVVIHPYRLCVRRGEVWTPLWKTTTGPAPRTLQLECALTAQGGGKCRASWNKQAFVDPLS
jgi:hypothetical protein